MGKTRRLHSGVVKRSVIIHSTKEKVWRTISNITNLPRWVSVIKKTILKSKIKKGVGAIRDVILDDNTVLEEHIVDWQEGSSFSYVAVTGMSVRTYFATLSIKPGDRNSVILTWSCYINSKKITRDEFNHLDDCEFNHYSLQLSLYKMLYKEPVEKLLIVHITPTEYKLYDALDLECTEEKVKKWLS